MSTQEELRKKRKRRIKRKYLIIRICLLIVLLSLIFCLGKLIFSDKKEEKTKENKPTHQKVEPEKEKYTKEVKEKLTKLNFINEKITYFKMDYLDRYVAYKEKNPNLKDEKVVLYVNIGNDQPHYTNTKVNTDLNSNLILVNKYYSLPENYVPETLENVPSPYSSRSIQLKKVAKDAWIKLVDQAKKDGYTVQAMSSYRSYSYQKNLYNNYVKSDGVAAADTYSARPGFSEHQTGLTVDIWDTYYPYTSFGQSKSYTWMKNHAHEYGFIQRYPEGTQSITGYRTETWHYRYVGIEAATYIHNNNITFDEYYMMFVDK